MSDFDKEAEREKLRERFERDEEKRKHTQQMSELLLRGATMTNRHCTDCGDPIFRQNGQEFCPTCGAEADVEAAEGAAGAEDAGAAGAEEPEATGRADRESRESAAASRSDSRADAASTAESSTAESGRAASGTTAEAGRDAERPTADVPDRVTAERKPTTPEPPAPAGESAESTANRTAAASAGDDLAAARDSLRRTVRKFARAAESTDDPRRAREHLQAAREAAEALAALT